MLRVKPRGAFIRLPVVVETTGVPLTITMDVQTARTVVSRSQSARIGYLTQL